MKFGVERNPPYGLGTATTIFAIVLFVMGIGGGAILLIKVRNDPLPAIVLSSFGIFCSLVFAVVAVLAHRWPKMFPQNLSVREGKIQLCYGQEVVGEIPITNVREIKVIRGTAPTPNNAGGLAGGLAGGFAVWEASKRYRTGIGLSIILRRTWDEQTFWPDNLRASENEARLEITWAMTYQEIHDALKSFLPQSGAGDTVGEDIHPQRAEQPRSEKNPFDFS